MKKCRERRGSASDSVGTMERCLACEANSVGTAERCLPAAAGRGRKRSQRTALLRTVHILGMPLNRRRRFKQRRSCNQRPFPPMMGSVVPRKFWFLLVILMSATIAVCGLSVSGCAFGDDNVGSIGAAAPTPIATPQIPESMKTNDMGDGSQGPPQGL
jgi:hypothetical protein